MAKGMVSAVCINWVKKEILLALNTDPEKPLGFWGLPGGKMKEGESPEAEAIRELYQETNQEGTVTKFAVEVPKTGPYGDYIHSFIAVRIISSERELKNYEDSTATPKWIPLEELIAGRVKMFRGHIRGLRLILEKIVEEKERTAKKKFTKHGVKIISESPFALVELLNELKNAFQENGQYIPFYRRRE